MTGFVADAGRMAVTNGSGDTVFDTDEGLFVVTDRKTGSITIPERTATYVPPNSFTHQSVDMDHSVPNGSSTTINPAANTVRGTFNVTVSTQGALLDAGKYNAGGAYMHYCHAHAQETSGPDHHWPGAICIYTFVASGGTLVLNEQTFMRPPIRVFVPATQTLTILSSTLNYDLIIGTFV